MITNAVLFYSEKIGRYIILLPEDIVRENEQSIRSWSPEEIHLASDKGVGLIAFKSFGTIRNLGSNLENHFCPLKLELADSFNSAMA